MIDAAISESIVNEFNKYGVSRYNISVLSNVIKIINVDHDIIKKVCLKYKLNAYSSGDKRVYLIVDEEYDQIFNHNFVTKTQDVQGFSPLFKCMGLPTLSDNDNEILSEL